MPQIKQFDFADSKFNSLPFAPKDWPDHENGVPGATNLPSMPASPLSIKVQDPNQVVTMVSYSGTIANDQIDSIDIKPLVGFGPGNFAQVGTSERAMTDPISSPKMEPFKW